MLLGPIFTGLGNRLCLHHLLMVFLDLPVMPQITGMGTYPVDGKATV